MKEEEMESVDDNKLYSYYGNIWLLETTAIKATEKYVYIGKGDYCQIVCYEWREVMQGWTKIHKHYDGYEKKPP